MKKFFALIIIVSGTVQTFAQEKVSLLSFKEAVKIALNNNILLKQQKNQLVASRVSMASGLASLGPNVTVSGNAGRNDGNSFNAQQGEVVNGVVDFVNGSIDANMTLFGGFNRLNTYKQTRYQLESQLNTVKRTNQDIIQSVSTQYLQCLLDEELLRIAKQNVETQEQQLAKISEEVEVGRRAEVDKFTQEFQVKNTKLLVLRAENQLRNDKALLAQTLQLDPGSNFDMQDPEWDVNKINTDRANLEELYSLALGNRADLETARNNEKATKFGFRATQGNYYPRIGAFFSYGSAYNYIQDFPGNRSFDQQFTEDNVQTTYGLTLNVPIFNGLRTRSSVVQSKVNYQNASLDVQNTVMQVKSDVLLAYQNLRDARTSYGASLTQLEAGEISFNLEKERYDLGVSDLVQFTQANQAYVTAQSDFARANYTLLFQDILLNYALGTLKFEDLP